MTLGVVNAAYASNRRNVRVTLNPAFFQLSPVYNDIYQMNYITVEMLQRDIPVFVIKEKFNEHNMAAYFGDRANLSCIQVRDAYLNILHYFRTIFMDKIEDMLGVYIELLPKEEPALCMIAECLNIIRASIKKYMRYRTSLNQRRCSKAILDQRNAEVYGCTTDDVYCPSFNYLRSVKRKSCKDIVISSGTTSDIMTYGSHVMSTTAPRNEPMLPLPPLPPRLALQTRRNRPRNVARLRSATRRSVRYPTESASSPFFNYTNGYPIPPPDARRCIGCMSANAVSVVSPEPVNTNTINWNTNGTPLTVRRRNRTLRNGRPVNHTLNTATATGAGTGTGL